MLCILQLLVDQTVTVDLVACVIRGHVCVGTTPCVPDIPTLCVVPMEWCTQVTASSTGRHVPSTGTSRWMWRGKGASPTVELPQLYSRQSETTQSSEASNNGEILHVYRKRIKKSSSISFWSFEFCHCHLYANVKLHW